jgi:hypothetical protein
MSARLSRILLCLVVLGFSFPKPAISQQVLWPDGPKIIQPGVFQTAIPDGRGGAILALSSSDYPLSNGTVLQRVDASGEPLWGAGLLLPGVSYLYDGCLAGNERDGYYVLHYASSDASYYLVLDHVGPDGRIRWSRQVTTQSNVYPIRGNPLAVTADGGVVVIYAAYSAYGVEFIAQKISREGEMLNSFPILPSGVSSGEFAVGSDGGVFAAYSPESYGPTYRVRYIDPRGNLVWERTVLPSIPETWLFNSIVKLAEDGKGGVFCLWTSGQDDWRRPSYHRIRLQRYSSSGEPLWGTEGVTPFFDIESYRAFAQLRIVPLKRAILVWGVASGRDEIYAERFDLTGRTSWKQTASVCTYPFPYSTHPNWNWTSDRIPESVEAVVDKSNAVVFSWRDGRSHGPYLDLGQYGNDLYVSRISPAGKTIWTFNGYCVPNAPFDTTQWLIGWTVLGKRAVSDGEGGLLTFGSVRSAGSSAWRTAMQRVVPAEGPPSTPTIQDKGLFTFSLDSLSATLQSVDREHEVTDYEYAVSTRATINEPFDVISWTSNGASPVLDLEGLSLNADTDYYICARAKNSIGLWSSPGWSDGVSPVVKTDSIAQALTYPLGWRVLPPWFLITQVLWDHWIVTESLGGPSYKVSTHASATPGDSVYAVCKVRPDWGDNPSGTSLELVQILALSHFIPLGRNSR